MNTLSELLFQRRSAAKGITFIEKGEGEVFMSYNELYEQAGNAHAALAALGVQPGNEVVFQIENNRRFTVLFWGCILGGFIPVPLTPGKNDSYRQKLFSVWQQLNQPWLLGTTEMLHEWEDFAKAAGVQQVYEQMKQHLAEPGIFSQEYMAIAPAPTGRGSIAFIQFSSGSTGDPKGVILTHENLLLNIDAIGRAAAYTENDIALSWMPLTHDMGLIGFHLSPLYSNMNQVLLSPALFIQRPSLWLDAANRYRATVLSSPNFGYSYFLKHCAAEHYNWNLSAVRIIYNGAEPISEKICTEFTTHLRQYQLRENSICPVYGLAEASVAVSMTPVENSVDTVFVHREQLNAGNTVVVLDKHHAKAIGFVSVGRPIPYVTLRITDGGEQVWPGQTVGHIEIKGGNVTSGYYNNETATRAALTHDGWIRTGDLGFLLNGNLYVIGRHKDIIFYNGQNFYPADLERMVVESGLVELNKIAAGGWFNPNTGKEEVLVFIYHRGATEQFLPLAEQVKQLLNMRVNLPVDHLVPVKEIPRTTSGKLKRHALVSAYRNGQFNNIIHELQQLFETRTQQQAAEATAFTPTEQLMAQVWRQVLNKKHIAASDHFFMLGGNSLQAAEVEMRMYKATGKQLPPGVLYTAPVLRNLAEITDRLPVEPQQYTIPFAPVKPHYPLTRAQLNIFNAWLADNSSTAYNLPVAIRLNITVKHDLLQNCLQELVNRFDSLRISLVPDNTPFFITHKEVPVILNRQMVTDGELQNALRQAVQPFSLTEAPLFRFVLFETGSGRQFLFLDVHHLVMDGIAVSVFLQNLLAVYNQERLTDMPVSFTDYAVWEQQQRNNGQQALDYWRQQLSGSLPVLELATDFPRPAVFSHTGSRQSFVFDREVSNKLRQLALGLQVSVHAVMFALYRILLSRYTGQPDIVVGIPVSGRLHADILELPGMFVNNLPMRIPYNGDTHFAGFVQEVFTRLHQAFEHQAFPFAELLRLLPVARNASRNPLFDTMFLFQNMNIPAGAASGLQVEHHFFDPGFSKYDLSMEVFPGDTHIVFAIEYSTALFKKSTIHAMAGHFCQLAKQVLLHPGMPLKQLPLLTGQEQQRFVEQFNRTETLWPDIPVHMQFVQRALRTPGAIVVEEGTQTYTCAQVNEWAMRIADLLANNGITGNRVVAVYMNRSAWLIGAILGILRSGAAYLLLDTGAPEQRNRYILADSGSSALLYATEKGGSLPAYCFPDTPGFFSFDMGLLVNQPQTIVPVEQSVTVQPNDLAYLLYTSGTTGQPKGVMIEHRSLANYIHWAAQEYAGNKPATFPLFTSVSFDLTVTSVFTPLVTGGRIVIYTEENHEALLEKIFTDNRLTIIKLTPAHLAHVRNSNFGFPENTQLKALIVGGEQLNTQLAADIYRKLGEQVVIYNEYGPTEATVGCMIYTYRSGDQENSVPIGVPAPNTKIYLLDEELQHVPAGVAGEIYIGGEALARGYMGRETLTREKFLPDPFLAGARMYKTGDRAKRLENGILVYLGRNDEQVKINGYRVEPAEISSQLNKLDGINDSLVVLKTTADGRQALCAYYTGPVPVATETIRHYLAGQLPYYMMPAFFIHLPAIPLTPNGKTDTAALPDPILVNNTTADAPAGMVEEAMQMVWSEVLNQPVQSRSAGFFALGGDSIKAFRVASALLIKGISISVKDILTYQTIADISGQAVFVHSGANGQPVSGSWGRWPIAGWFFACGHPYPGYYNQSVLLDLTEPVQTGPMEKAFEVICASHDVLRMNTDEQGARFFYRGADEFPPFSISRHTIPAGDRNIEQEAITAIAIPLKLFNLCTDQLIRAAIISSPNGQQRLFITAHHLVIDALSWPVLLADLASVYQALQKNEQPVLPPKTASFSNWCNELNRFFETTPTAQEEAYWQQTIEQSVAFPADNDTTEWTMAQAEQTYRVLDAGKTALLLHEANRPYQTTTEILLYVVLMRAIERHTGYRRFVIEREGHGRYLDTPDVSRTMGWFTALHPVLLTLNGSTIGEQVQEIKTGMKNIPGQGLGFGKRFCQVQENDGAEYKRAELRFNYLGSLNDDTGNRLFRYSRLNTGAEVHTANRLTAAIEINAAVIEECLHLRLTYNRLAHEATTINRLLDIFLEEADTLLQHLAGEKDIHFTPSDFDAAQLDQEELDTLFQ
ncbi:MAG: amino acid adenylation domain-containing protein [Dinghuibacter sp.]|nr:amino acid adenylation domain-containing protein [Dinghuibacter sp.]